MPNLKVARAAPKRAKKHSEKSGGNLDYKLSKLNMPQETQRHFPAVSTRNLPFHTSGINKTPAAHSLQGRYIPLHARHFAPKPGTLAVEVPCLPTRAALFIAGAGLGTPHLGNTHTSSNKQRDLGALGPGPMTARQRDAAGGDSGSGRGNMGKSDGPAEAKPGSIMVPSSKVALQLWLDQKKSGIEYRETELNSGSNGVAVSRELNTESVASSVERNSGNEGAAAVAETGADVSSDCMALTGVWAAETFASEYLFVLRGHDVHGSGIPSADVPTGCQGILAKFGSNGLNDAIKSSRGVVLEIIVSPNSEEDIQNLVWWRRKPPEVAVQPCMAGVLLRLPGASPQLHHPAAELAPLTTTTRVLRSDRARRVSDPTSPSLRGGPFPVPPGSPLTPLSSPSPTSLPLDFRRLGPAFLITPPSTAGAAPRVPPPLPPRPVRRLSFPPSVPLTRVPLAPTPLVIPPQKPVAAMDLQFSGKHDKVELSAANFMKKLNMLHRTNKTPEAEKFIDVADRFEEDSPAEKWFNNLQATVPTPAAASDWAAFQTAFKARFKGAPPVLKPVAQLEDELSRMRITLGALAAGTVEVRGRQVYVLADFVERLTDAVIAVNTLTSAVGLWGFHAALLHVLQSAVGVMPANWLAMTTALGAIPQSVIALAIADYKEKRSTKADVKDLKKVFSSPARCEQHRPLPQPITAVATTALKGVGCKGGATAEQKEQLRKVLEACIARRHPNTPTGLAEYAADIRTWDRKFGSIARTQLRLELTGYPLIPGVADPCMGAGPAGSGPRRCTRKHRRDARRRCSRRSRPRSARSAGCGSAIPISRLPRRQ
ncbi:hypothetical protein DFH09DRAFT_1078234 [Mycena vulgaris]|nr:hypothetical protein DFH09DRAFT_1078234 [Mycena vulgaris]